MSAPQSPPPPPSRPPRPTTAAYVFHSHVGEVYLQATVAAAGHPVAGLPPADFTVFENGVPQQIQSFLQTDVPVSLGIVVDASGSMFAKRHTVNRAAMDLIQAGNPQDEVFIANFNSTYRLGTDFTADPDVLQQGLNRVVIFGGTALYDALLAALQHLNQDAARGKKVLLLITDGDDDDSHYNLAQTLQVVQTNNPALIYCIGLLNQEGSVGARDAAQKALRQLAETTGGLAYFPSDVSDVDAITRQIARDIRSQYNLVYHSNQATLGFRTIRLEVHDPKYKKLAVRTRAGYLPVRYDDSPTSR